MKGLAGSAMAAAAITLGLLPIVAAASLRKEQADNNGRSGAVKLSGPSPRREELDGGRLPRQLQRGNDDALDVNGTPKQRAAHALQHRTELAGVEYVASRGIFHSNNGDRSSAATFHKTLPHDSLGQVDPDAFDALINCIAEGDFDTCEDVPSGDTDGFLINPIAGSGVNMGGPASSALTVPSAPSLDSEDMAAQMAELYWMALTRDVNFSQYGEDETTVAAAENLSTMTGFSNMKGVAVGSDGRADPQSQLFRSSAVGVETGPFISQLLVKDFTLDSITVAAKQTTYLPGDDYMTTNEDWLFIQNGGQPDSSEEEDAVKRYIRNARDLARLVYTDTVCTEAFRGAMILLEEGAISKAGFNGPYENSSRQKGFVNFGVSHVMRILGSAEQAQASSWYQKWNVHLLARPEAVGGTLHNVLYGKLDVDFHTSLLENKELLERVAVKNAELNGGTGERGRTYFLSQAVKEGSPAHPSYPAGHAVQNGAFATVLKALVGLERGAECFDDPVYPDEDGLELLSYVGGDCLTYEGEINKMAVNVAFGRSMCGVHYRFDSEEGLVLGEAVGVRMLQQEARSFPENEGYEFRLFSGETIRLEPDGSFFIDDRECIGDAFTGVGQC